MTDLHRREDEAYVEPARASRWAFFGMAALACLLFLDVGSLVISPWWAVALLVMVWIVLFRRACRWFTKAPERVSTEAALGFGIWLAVEILGGVWLW